MPKVYLSPEIYCVSYKFKAYWMQVFIPLPFCLIFNFSLKLKTKAHQRNPREAEAQQQHRAYAQYRPAPQPEIVPSAETGRAEVRRTFRTRDSRNSRVPVPTRAPLAQPAPTTSAPSLYYFKPVDSQSTTSSYPEPSTPNSNDNLAVPNQYQPTYIVYPTESSKPNPTTPSSQKYLKSTFRPAGSYDAPTSKSIYREETSKFHAANLVHLPKVVMNMLCFKRDV